jgi:hypothetical protein
MRYFLKMPPRLRRAAVAALLVASATLTACGSTATTLPPPTINVALHSAAADSRTLRGIALDSCTAWRLVSIESTRKNRARAAHYFRVTQRLAATYMAVVDRYDRHRQTLPPMMFLPPSEPLVALERGVCWI